MSSPRRVLPPGLDLVLDGGRTAKIGQLQRSAAAGAELRRPPPPPERPNLSSRPIRSQCPGLDRGWVRSEPRDLDPTDGIHAYRFALGFKSGPSISDLAGGIRSELRESLERRIEIRRPIRVDTISLLESNLGRRR
jgi:hypothetical protein